MFERFSDGARRSVALAGESATDLGHRVIATEHLLLGVAAAEPGAGAAALVEYGIGPDRLRAAVEAVVPPSAPPEPAVPLDPDAPPEPGARSGGRGWYAAFSPAAKKVLELSLRESLLLKAPAIDSGHILLALLAHGGDELPAVLSAAGIDTAALRAITEKQLAGVTRLRLDRAFGPDPLRMASGQGRLDRIEALLTDVVARLERIERRLEES